MIVASNTDAERETTAATVREVVHYIQFNSLYTKQKCVRLEHTGSSFNQMLTNNERWLINRSTLKYNSGFLYLAILYIVETKLFWIFRMMFSHYLQ